MVEKTYITRKKTATLICPKCQRSKTVDVSQFVITSNKNIKINVKCPCGHAFTSFLERRKRYRKETKLPGSFARFVADKPAGRGYLLIRDLSSTGMKIEVYENFKFSEGDILKIEFQLDDSKKTLITKKVVIRSIKNSFIGTEFLQTEAEDKALGFYLMS